MEGDGDFGDIGRLRDGQSEEPPCRHRDRGGTPSVNSQSDLTARAPDPVDYRATRTYHPVILNDSSPFPGVTTPSATNHLRSQTVSNIGPWVGRITGLVTHYILHSAWNTPSVQGVLIISPVGYLIIMDMLVLEWVGTLVLDHNLFQSPAGVPWVVKQGVMKVGGSGTGGRESVSTSVALAASPTNIEDQLLRTVTIGSVD